MGPSLGTINLQPSNDGLFVIGILNASMGSNSRALFTDMALQPVPTPTQNKLYSFRFAAATGDDLLRQVHFVSVQLQLLRCTLGQHMTVSEQEA